MRIAEFEPVIKYIKKRKKESFQREALFLWRGGEACNHADGVDIINFAEIGYRQHEVLYLIKLQRNARRGVMISTTAS